ncbi:DL-endopeptidase inhibitor IseA family protein [Paenibacillus piri]|uniref:Copper amine oxidase-like N-terminal domain-containing protein n=1 Tax=Paenibacillus piri TaxID=2547395 RepID=A0A4R5K8Y4_9BACL|nr:DL-endopeptidase inhibitor IseA family protein [Paenibacillus piri]TDF91025.1 hypothetical protein E1757_33540 [Paenibacillus piri]
MNRMDTFPACKKYAGYIVKERNKNTTCRVNYLKVIHIMGGYIILNLNWKSFVSGLLVGSALFSSISYAAPEVVKLIVNGKEVVSEVPAQIVDGSTLIPARALAEALGAKVAWDEGNRRVIVEGEGYNRYMDEQEAVRLAGAAQRHYWHISIGGLGSGAAESFDVKGTPYRLLGGDLDTKAKFTAFIEEVTTPEQAAAYWSKQTENGSIVEVNGKLAQPNADGGSLRNWNGAKAVLVRDGADLKTYAMTVPVGDTGETEQHEVKVRLVPGKGWRLDGMLDLVR